MPYHDSPSPARRSQLTERSSSAHSLSRASPSTAKGSTTKLHKAHAVGHGRHSHGRNPSYGRNLNKLSKLTAARAQDEQARSRPTPSPSPQNSTANINHDISNANLPRVSSKVSIKRNASGLSQKRNKSSSKLGHLTKTDKAQRKSSDRAEANGVQFSMGSDDEDEGWTEADSSQSPETTRRGSIANVQTQRMERSSPDGPPLKPPTQLPASPPQSPPVTAQQEPHHDLAHHQPNDSSSQVPDTEAVTSRLLSRNTAQNVKSQTSTISTTTTPSGSSGSPAFNFGQDSTLRNDQSMPSDGISRFLNTTSSSSGNATPASLSHLNSALVGVHINQEHPDKQLHSTSPQHNASSNLSRQARSTPNLASSNRTQSTSSRSSSPSHPQSGQASFDLARPSPFAARRKGQSRTQEKLNLQRDASNREPPHAPAVQPPSSSALANGTELSTTELRARAWNRAETEYDNARRFLGILGKGVERLDKRGKISGTKGKDGGLKAERDVVVSISAESRPESRGRVRFEVGRSYGDGSIEADGDSDGGGLEGLLRRMWEGDGQSGGED